MAAEDIGGILECLWSSFYGPISTEIGHVRNFKKNVGELIKKTKDLTAQYDENSVNLSIAKSNGGRPLDGVINWRKKVDDMKEEVSKIQKKLEGQNRCCKGLVPNCYMRSKIAKESSRLIVEVDKLIKEGEFTYGLTFQNLRLARSPISCREILGETMNLKKKEIWDCIVTKDRHGIIGIHGMGGAGKTNIMGNINNDLLESKDFDDVIWVTVSKDSDVDKLQTKIAEKLQIELIGDAQVRQSDILTALSLRNKFLLILDDMWEAVDPVQVGIPCPSEKNGCKIVLTTRNEAVCTVMEAHPVKVDTLSEEESLELFKSKMGNVKLPPRLEPIAKLVAKECCGLPLAIETVAKVMSRQINEHIWERNLEKLRRGRLDERSLEKVFSRLKFSYTELPNAILRSCFLYCSLYPEEYEIPTVELIDYWICEGLIDEQMTRKDAINEGHVVLNELIKSSLLEELPQSGGNYERVRMHDLIRDMAIQITEEEGPVSIINAGVKLEDLPTDWPEDAQRISLMQSHIETLLGTRPMPSRLLTLLLQENPLNAIPDSYFNQMCLLKVLDLSGTKIESLPVSISNLKDLRALSLRQCIHLKEVSSLSELDQLRSLDLSETSIQELPAGMKAMVKLQRLNLNGTRELHLFPAGIISKLSRLEELTMCRSRWTWSEMKGEGATIEEIMNSNKLVELDINFKDLSYFLNCVNSNKWQILKRFSLGVGSRNLEVDGTSQGKFIVEVSDCDLIGEENSLLIPEKTEWLNITYCRISSLCHLTRLLCNAELYGCQLYNINEMQFLMVEGEALLPNLKYLRIQTIFLLRGLCKGIPSPDALKNLESLHVSDCNNLEYLFPARLLQQLRSLKLVEVFSCSEMEEIVREEEEMEMELSQLQSLKMWGLPKLKSICSSVVTCNALETVDVRGCPKLKKLPFSVHSLPALRKIIGGDEWWADLNWNDSETKDHLKPFHECP